MLTKFKGSAIHNLIITASDVNSSVEGLFLGEDIMYSSDIKAGEEIIITRIGAGLTE